MAVGEQQQQQQQQQRLFLSSQGRRPQPRMLLLLLLLSTHDASSCDGGNNAPPLLHRARPSIHMAAARRLRCSSSSCDAAAAAAAAARQPPAPGSLAPAPVPRPPPPHQRYRPQGCIITRPCSLLQLLHHPPSRQPPPLTLHHSIHPTAPGRSTGGGQCLNTQGARVLPSPVMPPRVCFRRFAAAAAASQSRSLAGCPAPQPTAAIESERAHDSTRPANLQSTPTPAVPGDSRELLGNPKDRRVCVWQERKVRPRRRAGEPPTATDAGVASGQLPTTTLPSAPSPVSGDGVQARPRPRPFLLL